LEDLEQKLKQYSSRPLKIGSFSAASNVTGVLAEVDTITVMLHRHGALVRGWMSGVDGWIDQ
jgi:selenocysteine lyase/cysteine desulfurase